MQPLSIEQLIMQMTSAFASTVKNEWPSIVSLVNQQMADLAKALVNIQSLQSKGEITQEQAKLDIQLAKNSAKTTLVVATGLKDVLINNALHNALSAVKDVVNAALGWVLL